MSLWHGARFYVDKDQYYGEIIYMKPSLAGWQESADGMFREFGERMVDFLAYVDGKAGGTCAMETWEDKR